MKGGRYTGHLSCRQLANIQQGHLQMIRPLNFTNSRYILARSNYRKIQRCFIEHLRLRVKTEHDKGLKLRNAPILSDDEDGASHFFNVTAHLLIIHKKAARLNDFRYRHETS